MELALPSQPSLGSWATRRDHLCSFALVHPAWVIPARQLLLTHPTLKTAEQIGQLQRCLKTEEMHGSAQTLWCGDGRKYIHGGLVLDLLASFRNTLWSLTLNKVHSMLLADLARCSGSFLDRRTASCHY